MGVVAPGVAAKIVGVPTTTTAVEMIAAVVEAREACRVLVVAQDAAKGATRAGKTEVWRPQLWGRHRRAAEKSTRSFSVGRLVHLLPLNFGLERGPRRSGRVSRQEVSRAIDDGASGPEALALLLRLLVMHFDRVYTGEGYTKLHTFVVCDGTPFSFFSREFHLLVAAVAGSERVLFSMTGVVLEVFRRAVKEQFPTLMPTLHPDSKSTDPRLFDSLHSQWRRLSELAHNRTPAVNGEKYSSLPDFSTRARSSAPSGLRPADHGSRQGRVPSQSISWQTGSNHHLTVMLDVSSDHWLDHTSNRWPLEKHH